MVLKIFVCGFFGITALIGSYTIYLKLHSERSENVSNNATTTTDFRKVARDFYKSSNEPHIDSSEANSPHLSMETIVPLIRSKSWLENYKGIIKEIEKRDKVSTLGNADPIYREFFDDMCLVFASNLEGLIYINTNFIEDKKLDWEELKKFACENTEKLQYDITQLGELPIYLLQTADGEKVTTAMLFNDRFWDKEVKMNLEENAIIAIPGTEFILFTKQSDSKAIVMLQHIYAKFYAERSEEPLKNQLFLRKGGKWEPYFPR